MTIIHSALATRSATRQGRVEVASSDQGGEEQESKAKGGVEGSMVLSSRTGIEMWIWKEIMMG
jgi:hypothetical protein